jgi:hypothetical protein
MKERLPSGKLFIYQVCHLKNPNTWLNDHNKYNLSLHLENFQLLQPLLKNSIFEDKEPYQNILCEISENPRLIGDLIISVNQILSDENILYDLKDGKIKATIEDKEGNLEVYYYSNASKKWKSHLTKPKSKYTSLHLLQFKTFLLKENNRAKEFLKGIYHLEKEIIPSLDVSTTPIIKIKRESIKGVREERNGIKRPNPGGLCAAVWDYLDEKGNVTPKEIKLVAESKGWNPNNAQMELYQYRKFHGITKNQQKSNITPEIKKEEILQNYSNLEQEVKEIKL